MSEMFLIGHGISHSLSPAMWNNLARRTNRPFRYGLRDVDASGLDSVLAELRSEPPVLAANVTMPHKGWAARVADRRSAAVVATGAANLLLPRESGIEAHNTDVSGARTILESRAPYSQVLVLGAGGTAGAILQALHGLADAVVIANRTQSRAEDLARRHGAGFPLVQVSPWNGRDRAAEAADLVVSTVPAVDEAPIEVARLQPNTLVYDAVYRHDPTPFQQAVTARGIDLADGLTHLAAQAIAMLDPLGFDPSEALHLVAGLEQATGREPTAWGRPLM